MLATSKIVLTLLVLLSSKKAFVAAQQQGTPADCVSAARAAASNGVSTSCATELSQAAKSLEVGACGTTVDSLKTCFCSGISINCAGADLDALSTTVFTSCGFTCDTAGSTSNGGGSTSSAPQTFPSADFLANLSTKCRTALEPALTSCAADASTACLCPKLAGISSTDGACFLEGSNVNSYLQRNGITCTNLETIVAPVPTSPSTGGSSSSTTGGGGGVSTGGSSSPVGPSSGFNRTIQDCQTVATSGYFTVSDKCQSSINSGTCYNGDSTAKCFCPTLNGCTDLDMAVIYSNLRSSTECSAIPDECGLPVAPQPSQQCITNSRTCFMGQFDAVKRCGDTTDRCLCPAYKKVVQCTSAQGDCPSTYVDAVNYVDKNFPTLYVAFGPMQDRCKNYTAGAGAGGGGGSSAAAERRIGSWFMEAVAASIVAVALAY